MMVITYKINFAKDNIKIVGTHIREDPYETHLIGTIKILSDTKIIEETSESGIMFATDNENVIFDEEGFFMHSMMHYPWCSY